MPVPTSNDKYVGFEIECFGKLKREALQSKLRADEKLRGKFDVCNDYSIRPSRIKPSKGDLKLFKKTGQVVTKFNPRNFGYDTRISELFEVTGKEGLFKRTVRDLCYYEKEYDGKRWKLNGVKYYPSKAYLNGDKNYTDRNYWYYYGKKDYYSRGQSNSYEIRLLCKQKELNHIVKRMYDILNENNIQVNKSCGLHIHLDMRQRNVRTAYKNLYYCQDSMIAVNKGRERNQYCRKNRQDSFHKQLGNYGRYYAINARSYHRHKTIEVRLGRATMNADEVIAWARMLTTIVDKESLLSSKVDTLNTFLEKFKVSQTNSKALKKMANKKAA